MDILGYIMAVIMGLTLGLVGGGGSILTVPILVYVFQVEPVLATAYSLFIVGLTALFGGITYQLKGEVDFKTGVLFAVPSFIGVYLVRSFVMPNIPEQLAEFGGFVLTKALLIMSVFALMMVFASLSMIKTKKPMAKKELSVSLKGALIAAEGLIVGGVTGFVGAGGGFLIIPALVVLVGLPMKLAVGTSLFIIATKSLIGFLGDVQHQASIDWVFMLKLSGLALLGLLVGSRFASRIPEQKLKKGFGYFVLIMGVFILVDQLRRI